MDFSGRDDLIGRKEKPISELKERNSSRPSIGDEPTLITFAPKIISLTFRLVFGNQVKRTTPFYTSRIWKKALPKTYPKKVYCYCLHTPMCNGIHP